LDAHCRALSWDPWRRSRWIALLRDLIPNRFAPYVRSAISKVPRIRNRRFVDKDIR
jgi:hypothetical protein